MRIKSISRDVNGGLYIANESVMHADAQYFEKIYVTLYGSKDVYYLDVRNGNMYAYRAKLDRIVNGCTFVRDRSEYDEIYAAICAQGFARMPENMFTRIDREFANRIAQDL